MGISAIRLQHILQLWELLWLMVLSELTFHAIPTCPGLCSTGHSICSPVVQIEAIGWIPIMEAEQIHNFLIYIHFLTLYLPPNTYPLFPTVAQA